MDKQLPIELYEQIFSYLEWKHLAKISFVCKEWNEMAKSRNGFRQLVFSTLVNWSKLQEPHIKWLTERIGGIKRFYFVPVGSTASLTLYNIKNYFPTLPDPRLAKVEGDDWKIRLEKEKQQRKLASDSIAQLFSKMTSVEILDLRGLESELVGPMIKTLEQVNGCGNIRELYMRESYKPTKLDLEQYSSLQRLEIEFSSRDANAEIPPTIATVSNLQELVFGGLDSSKTCDLTPLKKLRSVAVVFSEDKMRQPSFPLKLSESVKVLEIQRAHAVKLDIPATIEDLRLYSNKRCEVGSQQPKPLALPEISGHSLREARFVRMALISETFHSSPHAWMKDLTRLDVPYNYIDDISWVTQFVNLVHLDVSHNGLISKLPQGIDQLKRLRCLKCGVNSISELPESFAALSVLEELDLSENKLVGFPTLISSLSSLKILNLNENDIKELPDTAFEPLVHLTELYLMGTALTSIPDVFGTHTPPLQVLNLSYNKLDALPNSWARFRKTLNEVDLTFNTLETFPLCLPLGAVPASGNLLDALMEFLVGGWSVEPLLQGSSGFLPIAKVCERYLPPPIKLSKDYQTTPDQREGAWYILYPERRQYAGHGAFEQTGDSQEVDPLGPRSIWYHALVESVYRLEWKKYSFIRGRDFEGSWWWTKPTEERDRISASGFCGNAQLAGAVVGDVSEKDGHVVISGEYRVSGTARRNQAWNYRGHWQSFHTDVEVDRASFLLLGKPTKKTAESWYEPK